MNKVYPNNKPWMSKEVRAHLQQKIWPGTKGDPLEQKVANRESRSKITQAKQKYKAKVEKESLCCLVWYKDNGRHQ